MSVLLDGPSGVTELLDEERRALDALADAGLVPPLRLLPTPPPQMFGDRLRVV